MQPKLNLIPAFNRRLQQVSFKQYFLSRYLNRRKIFSFFRTAWNANFFIALVCPLFTCGQPVRVNECNKVKYGTFYFYPPKTNDEFVIIRDKDFQREIDLKTNDTSFWQLKWKNDCEFSLRFIRKSGPISDDEKAFYNAHVTVVQIARVSKQYYIYKGGLDSIESGNPLSDTIWFKPRIKVASTLHLPNE